MRDKGKGRSNGPGKWKCCATLNHNTLWDNRADDENLRGGCKNNENTEEEEKERGKENKIKDVRPPHIYALAFVDDCNGQSFSELSLGGKVGGGTDTDVCRQLRQSTSASGGQWSKSFPHARGTMKGIC